MTKTHACEKQEACKTVCEHARANHSKGRSSRRLPTMQGSGGMQEDRTRGPGS